MFARSAVSVGPAVLAALLLGCGGEAAPATPAARMDPLVAKLVAALDESLRRRPDDGVLLYQRAALAIEAGAPAEALPFLERLDASGWSVPLHPGEFEPLAGDRRYREIAARIDARAARVSRSAVAFSIPEPDLIPEGIAVDPRSGTFYLGSIRKRKVLAIDARGGVSTFVPAGRGGLLGALGVKVDTSRDLLWVGSYSSRTMMGHDPGAPRTEGVLAFALADGGLRRRVLFTDGAAHLPNDMAVAADGTLYVTDSAAGRIWRVPPDRDRFEPLTPASALVYPNGIALAADGRLYVAHLSGIAIVDSRSGAMTEVETVPGAPLGGIDGLLLEGGALLAVQNGIGRPRMVSIALDPTGERATGLTVLENDPAALELPTTACANGGALYTIANSQLRAFRTADGARNLEPPRILRTPL